MAIIRKLTTKRERIRADSADQLRQMVLDVEMPERLRGELVREIDRRAAASNEWVFQQMNAEQYDMVGDWIRQHAARPLLSFALWVKVPALLSPENEILADRRELAERIGTDADTISRIMAELEGIGVIQRQRQGSRVRYFLSPRILTTLSGRARELAQQQWPAVGGAVPRPTRGRKPRLVTT